MLLSNNNESFQVNLPEEYSNIESFLNYKDDPNDPYDPNYGEMINRKGNIYIKI
jgi:hypothetical protein